ncbi:MAG: sialidase family protein, partial [Planctomycetota bacterium]
MRKLSLAVAGSLLSVVAFAADEGGKTPSGEKLLCGFERSELEAWAAKDKQRHVWHQVGWRVEDATGGGLEFAQGKYGRSVMLTAEKGDASQGNHAMIRPLDGKRDFRAEWGKYYMKPHVTEPPRRDAEHSRAAGYFYTSWFGGLSVIMPADWSGYGWLLLDVKSTAADVGMTVFLEDDVIEPPLNRAYAVPAGTWVTLAFDLGKADKDGMLTPSKMTNIEILVDKTAGKTDILLDNLRLAGSIEGAKLPVVKDESPWRKPFAGAAPAEPRPVVIEAKPAREAITLAAPTVMEMKPHTSYTRFSQCINSFAAFDDRFMMFDGALTTGSSALFSSDGGRTWKGLDGGGQPTVLADGHQNSRNLWVDDNGGLIGIFILQCAGGPNRSDIYFRRVKFTGGGWEMAPFTLVDLDVRHCPERFALLRLASGQIWAAWDHLSRDTGTCLRLRVSDDDGRSWRLPEGAGKVNGQPVPLGGGPALVPWGGKGVACFWKSGRDGCVYWARSEDLKTWSDPQVAAQKTEIGAGVNAAVTVGGTDVFFSTEPGDRMSLRFLAPGQARLLRSTGNEWKEDAGPWTETKAAKLSSPNLSVSDGALVAAWVEENAGKYAIRLSKRKPDGIW